MQKQSQELQVCLHLSSIHSAWSISILYCLLSLCYQPATASTSTDWGVISVDQPSTYYVSGTDITQNFTDQYTFSISGGSNADYSVYVEFDFCKRGCGNPDVSYGIYALNGGLVSSSGSAVLSAGNYTFMVKGTGMGSGNSVDYNGSSTFSASAMPAYFVSAASEPEDIFLTITGSACLIVLVGRRREKRGLKPFGIRRQITSRSERSPEVLRVGL